MSEETKSITTAENWKPKYLIIGGAVGALVGLAAAYMMVQGTETDDPPDFSLGEGVKIGVLVLGLLRSIASL
jgi:hypothetical protein